MSQSATADTLNYISNQVNIYGYSVILVLGLFGNTLNIIMFATKLKNSVCTLYLLISDVCNMASILAYILPSIVQLTYGKNGTESSLLWSKLTNYIRDACILISTLKSSNSCSSESSSCFTFSYTMYRQGTGSNGNCKDPLFSLSNSAILYHQSLYNNHTSLRKEWYAISDAKSFYGNCIYNLQYLSVCQLLYLFFKITDLQSWCKKDIDDKKSA